MWAKMEHSINHDFLRNSCGVWHQDLHAWQYGSAAWRRNSMHSGEEVQTCDEGPEWLYSCLSPDGGHCIGDGLQSYLPDARLTLCWRQKAAEVHQLCEQKQQSATQLTFLSQYHAFTGFSAISSGADDRCMRLCVHLPKARAPQMPRQACFDSLHSLLLPATPVIAEVGARVRGVM